MINCRETNDVKLKLTSESVPRNQFISFSFKKSRNDEQIIIYNTAFISIQSPI